MIQHNEAAHVASWHGAAEPGCIDVHVHMAGHRSEAVPPTMIGSDPFIGHAHLLTPDPPRQVLTGLPEMPACFLAAARPPGIVEQRASFAGSLVLEQSLINQIVVQRHQPVVTRLCCFGVDPDVVDFILDEEVRRPELRYLVDPSSRVRADPRHPAPRLGILRRYVGLARGDGRPEDQMSLLLGEALLALLLLFRNPYRHFGSDVCRKFVLLLGVVERGLYRCNVGVPDRLSVEVLLRLSRQPVFLRLAFLGDEQLVFLGGHLESRQAHEVVMPGGLDERLDLVAP